MADEESGTPPESIDKKRDRQRRLRSEKKSCLPTAIFLSLHAALLFFGIVYLVPWIHRKLRDRQPPPKQTPVPEITISDRTPPAPTPDKGDSPPPVQPPVPEEPVVPFPPPAAGHEIDKLVASRRQGLTGKLLKVSRDGSDYGTLKDALSAARDGDIIEIGDSSVYGERIHIKGKKNLLLRTAEGAKPTIDAHKAKSTYCVLIESSPGTIVRGLHCIRARETAISIRPGCEGTIVAQNTCEDGCFGIRARSPGVTLVANICRNNNAVGYALEQSEDALLADNVSFESEQGGIKIARSPRAMIINNIIHHGGEHGIVVSSKSHDSSVLHNTIVLLERHLIRVAGADGVTVMNNLGARSGRCAISFDPRVKNAVCDYNLFDETRGYGEWKARPYAALEIWRGATGHGRHSLYEKPGFVNTDQDLRLLPNSPARGKASDGSDLGVSWEQSGLTILEKRPKPGAP